MQAATTRGDGNHHQATTFHQAFSRPLTRWLRLGALAFLATLLAACTTSQVLRDPLPVPASSKHAAVVVDASNGQILYAAHADETRYPASLTKMMTLYLMFEAIESGQMSLSTRIPVSANAARQPPSKLGLRPGQTIDAATAIKALVVKSGNDVAVAVAEHLGGSEDRFAEMMTAKARQLGMSRTVFRNASGLPDDGQRTSALDMARLGLALRQRYPQHYHYFSLRSFTYGGKTIRGHNKLLETMRGANGIKTGYIRASGYNVATSVELDGKRVIAVVMGGETANSRNAYMEEMVTRYLPKATRR